MGLERLAGQARTLSAGRVRGGKRSLGSSLGPTVFLMAREFIPGRTGRPRLPGRRSHRQVLPERCAGGSAVLPVVADRNRGDVIAEIAIEKADKGCQKLPLFPRRVGLNHRGDGTADAALQRNPSGVSHVLPFFGTRSARASAM